MAGGRPEPDGEPGTLEDPQENQQLSPVVAAWEKVRWIKERGGCGELLIFRAQTDDLNRQDLMSNKEIIAPVLNHLGMRPSINTLGQAVEEFFWRRRDILKKPLSRSDHRVQAWGLRRLVSVFARAARRPHIPREKWMRKLFVEAGIELPEGPDPESERRAPADGEGEAEDFEEEGEEEEEADPDPPVEIPESVNSKEPCDPSAATTEKPDSKGSKAEGRPLEATTPSTATPRSGASSLWSPSTARSSTVDGHWLKPVVGGFECVHCRLFSHDFEDIHAMPCERTKESIETELDKQMAKLKRLKQLRSRELELLAKASTTPATTPKAAPVGPSESPPVCPDQLDTLPYEVNEVPEAGGQVERIAKTKPSLTWNGEKMPETPSPGWGPSSPMSQQENPKGSKQGQAESSGESVKKDIFPPTPKDYGLGFFVNYKPDWAQEFLAKVKGSGMGKAMEHCIVYGKSGKEFLFSRRGLVGNPDKEDFPIRVIFQPHASQRNFQASRETVPPTQAEMDKIAKGIEEKLLPMLAAEKEAEEKPPAPPRRGEGILRVPAPPSPEDPDSPDVIVTSEPNDGETKSPHEPSGISSDGQPYEFFDESQPDLGEPVASPTPPSGGSCPEGGKGEEKEEEKKVSDSELAYSAEIMAAGVDPRPDPCARNFKLPKIYSEGVDGAIVLSSSFGHAGGGGALGKETPKTDVACEDGKAVPGGSTLDPKNGEKHEPSTQASLTCEKPFKENEPQPLPTLPKEITALDFVSPQQQVKPKAKAKAKAKAKGKSKAKAKGASAQSGRGRGRGRGGRGRGRACQDAEDGNEGDDSERESVADNASGDSDTVPGSPPKEAKKPSRSRVAKAKKPAPPEEDAPPPAKKSKVLEPGEEEDPPKTGKIRKPKKKETGVKTETGKGKRKTKEEVPATEVKEEKDMENEPKPSKRKRKSDPSNMSPEEIAKKAKLSRKSSAYHVAFKANLEHGEEIARQRAKEAYRSTE